MTAQDTPPDAEVTLDVAAKSPCSETAAGIPNVDHRALMQQVEEVIDHIERDPEDEFSAHSVVHEVISKLRHELGIYGARLYEIEGDFYRLLVTFPEDRVGDEVIRVPRTYPPIELCLMRGVVYMEAGDPRLDEELEETLGVKEFAAIEIGNEQYVIGFSVTPGQKQEEVLFSLGAVRHSINRRLREDRINAVLRQARQIQSSIMPRTSPKFGPFDIAGCSQSLETVGGDLFDYIPITDKILGLAIADASGHGLPAALQVRDIYTGLRMGLARDFKIVRTVERLNSIIHTSTLTSRFVSLFYGELELNGTFIAVNAGHPPPFHLAADGEVTFLDQGGAVLGPLSDATYDRSYVQIRPGDMMVLYTDGISEALAPGETPGAEAWEREEFGEERLIELARAHQGQSARQIVDAIFDAVAEWRGPHQTAQDDSTIIVVVHPES